MSSAEDPRKTSPPSAVPADEFLRSLTKTRLLTPEELQAFLAVTDPSRRHDTRKLAQELVRQERLTRHQATLAYQGKCDDLVLGPYVVLDRLGQGGMGTVLKAKHRVMNRVVALKVIRKEKLGNQGAIKRFQREIQAAGQLIHPNIVTAFDASQDGESHFLVMEYVEGEDLAKRVRRYGPLSISAACEAIRQAALGLQHAHEQGLVHRDIKPQNLLASSKGVIKILDMGLARLIDPNPPPGATVESGMTLEGTLLGTPDFIAPEQVMDTHRADIRSDVYSLGCTLYFLLTGRPPFQGATVAEVLVKHQIKEPEPVEHVRPEVPPVLAALLRRMMAKQPEARFQTPAELAAAIAPFTGPVENTQADLACSGPRPATGDSSQTGETVPSLPWLSDQVLSAKNVGRDGTFPGGRGKPVGGLGPLVSRIRRLPVAFQLGLLLTIVVGGWFLTVFWGSPSRPTAEAATPPDRTSSNRDEIKLIATGSTLLVVGDRGENLKVRDFKELAEKNVKLTTARLKGHPTLTDADLAHLAKITTLERLDLSGTNITDDGLARVADLVRLDELVLDGTAVTDVGLKRLWPLRRLRTLSLKATPVTSAGLRALTLGGSALESLNLYGTAVADLEPLRAMMLKDLRFDVASRLDLEVLRSLRGLGSVNGAPPAQFAATVDSKLAVEEIRKAWGPLLAFSLKKETDLNPAQVLRAGGQYSGLGSRLDPGTGLVVTGVHTHSVVWWNAAVGRTFCASIEVMTGDEAILLWGGPGYGTARESSCSVALKPREGLVRVSLLGQQPGSAPLPAGWKKDQWYRLDLVSQAGSIRLFVDGALLGEWEEREPLKGLEHEYLGVGAAGTATFRNLKVFAPAWAHERRQSLPAKKRLDPPETVARAANGILLFDDNFVDDNPMPHWRPIRDPHAVTQLPEGLQLSGPNAMPELWRLVPLKGNVAVECRMSFLPDVEPQNFNLLLSSVRPKTDYREVNGWCFHFPNANGVPLVTWYPEPTPPLLGTSSHGLFGPVNQRQYVLRLERVAGRVRAFSNDRFLLDSPAPPAVTGDVYLGVRQGFSGSVVKQIRAWALE